MGHHGDRRTRSWRSVVRGSCQKVDRPSKGIACYKWSSPRRVFLAVLLNVGGSHYSIESGFEQTNQEVGEDHYDVRSWDGGHRHVTLVLLAHAFRKVLRIKATGSGPHKKQVGDAAHPPDRAQGEAYPGRHS